MWNDTVKNQIFFSYRRKNGAENIKKLKESVEACAGLNAFVDMDELRS